MQRSNDTVVFLGPSLPRSEAEGLLAATYLPPVRKGDVYAQLASGVRRIVVIDGIFHGGPSVWQRELLAAIDEGIEVLGASSMGALRAAELHAFGMTGIGTVFEWFRDGVLDGDDEVALRHATEELGYRGLSEPLVNLRATLCRATADGQLSPDEEAAIVVALKRTCYPGRSRRAVLASPVVQGWPAERRDGFAAYLAAHAVDVQADDARRVLAHCAHRPIGAPAEQAARDEVRPVDGARRVDPWSQELRRVALEFRTLSRDGRTLAWRDLRAGLRRRQARWAEARAQATVAWCIADLARRRPGGPASAPAPLAAWAEEHAIDDVAAWARAHGLTQREHAEIVAHRAIVAGVRRAGPAALGIRWDDDAATRIADRLADGPAPVLTPADCALLAAWLDLGGFECPRAEQGRWFVAWGLATADERAQAARTLGLSAARFRRALAQRTAATWLASAGLERFGVMIDLDVLAALDFQFSATPAELFAIGGAA